VRNLHSRDANIARKTAPQWTLLLFILCLAVMSPALLSAQKFASLPALGFSKTFGGDDPLSQRFTVASTGISFPFSAAATTTTGGAWLTITPNSFGCCGATTPYGITVNANPAVTLAAGTYTGQIVLTARSGPTPPLTIPVTLVIHAATASYFDQIAGGLTFSLQTGGLNAPPGQALQIRKAGAGSLAWTATASTADGGAWLVLSAASGTTPSNLSVSIVPSKLPGISLTAGTFVGQVVLKTAGDTVTVPITVEVGTTVFRQINPLNFNKTFGGANPLAQVITVGSSGAQFPIYGSVQSSTGGNWLTITPGSFGCCGLTTPQAITVGVNPAVTLAVGTYMSEVTLVSADGSHSLMIPVTLRVNAANTAFFDNVAGAVDFSMATAGENPPSQEFQVRNAGAGALAWTASASTADGGNWLSVTAASGTAPSEISVAVNPAKLPSSGLVAGTFVGQVVLQSAASRLTIPVSLPVGASIFRQVNPLNFTKLFAGANPLSQVITIASTGAQFTFNAVTVDSTGGSWLTINPSGYGCCGANTPRAITVSVNPPITLAAGTYTAEIVVKPQNGGQSLTIPVTLAIEPNSVAFFDALPGQMSFYMITKGTAPPPQVLPIRNAGTGTLNWTAVAGTSDGGAWLNISSFNGTAPSNPAVSVNPANLPGGGLVAGTFTGQVLLQAGGNPISIPVSFVVGANVFRQINPLTFTMAAGGANPLPQVITATSTGTNFPIFATTSNSTGGTWLSITPSGYGCCGINTPQAITVSVTAPPTMPAGTYSSEVIITSGDGTQGLTVPVTLIVKAKTDTFFDSLPGELTYSMVTGGTAPPAQPLEIRNAGAGSLAWTASLSTSDGGAWLTISAPSGTASAAPLFSVVPAKLPGGGLVAGTFTGQVILQTAGDTVTIPVTMVVGAAVFRQVNALDFNKVFGGLNPLPQLVSVTSTGANFPIFAVTANSGGGNWLQINPNNYGCCGINAPHTLIVTVNPDVTLPAGVYTAEIIVKAGAGSPSMVIPVTLTVNPVNATSFDDTPGGVNFFQVPGGANPAAQSVPIRNAGAGTLDWTASATTSDGGAWLTISAASGTAPSSLSVGIVSANLPGKGLVAGSFNGTIVLISGTGRQTIPVSTVVGANVFKPVHPLAFTKSFGAVNPAAQTLNLDSTGTKFSFFGQAASNNGGTWLTINPSGYGCCGISTPLAVQASVVPATPLAAGSYVGEIIFTSSNGDQGMVVPVTLTVNGTAAAAIPVFTPPGGTYTNTQSVTISGATRGTAIYYTVNGTTPTTASTVYSGPHLCYRHGNHQGHRGRVRLSTIRCNHCDLHANPTGGHDTDSYPDRHHRRSHRERHRLLHNQRIGANDSIHQVHRSYHIHLKRGTQIHRRRARSHPIRCQDRYRNGPVAGSSQDWRGPFRKAAPILL
jgi:hypothetical protein